MTSIRKLKFVLDNKNVEESNKKGMEFVITLILCIPFIFISKTVKAVITVYFICRKLSILLINVSVQTLRKRKKCTNLMNY